MFVWDMVEGLTGIQLSTMISERYALGHNCTFTMYTGPNAAGQKTYSAIFYQWQTEEVPA